MDEDKRIIRDSDALIFCQDCIFELFSIPDTAIASVPLSLFEASWLDLVA